MVKFDIERINAESPYRVKCVKGENEFRFTTDYGIDYNVCFLEDDFLQCAKSYQLIISNISNKKSPRDSKLRETITIIIYNFFDNINPALFYFCDTTDSKQRQRARLFQYWFNSATRVKEYICITAVLPDEDNVDNFTAIIVRADNPLLKEIAAEYTETIQLLRQKP